MYSTQMKQFQDYQYKIVRSLDDESINQWVKLEQDTDPIVFQRIFFIKNWFKNLYSEKKNKLFIIFIYKSDNLLSVLPFCINNFFIFKSLEWIGEPFNDINFPIFKKEIINKLNFNEFLREILIEFNDEITFIRLKKQIKCFNNIINPLHYRLSVSSSEKRKVLYFKSKKESKLSEFEAFIDNQKSKLFKRIKQRVNKYNFIFKSHQGSNLKYKNETLQFLIKNKSEKMTRTKVWNYLSFQKYKNYIKDILNSKYAHGFELYLNKKLIACQIGYKIKNHYYYIFPAYNNDYKSISPGHLGIYFLLRELINEQNNITFDFTIGNETYKDYWINQEEHLFTNYYYKNFIGKFLINLIIYFDYNRNFPILKKLKQIYIKFKK